MTYREVLEFWLEEIEPAAWWKKDEAFDVLLRERFLALHAQAVAGELFGWREHAQGRLAAIRTTTRFWAASPHPGNWSF